MALEGQLELGGRLRVADDLLGDREQLADLVLAALRPVVGVERERERRRVTAARRASATLCRASAWQRSGSSEKCSSMASRPSSLARSAVSVVGQRGERLLEQPDDRRVGGALLDPTSGEPERRTREVLPEARGPREVRGGLEGGAALIELARLAVGLAEAEQQLAAGRRSADSESASASSARSKWLTASSYASAASARRAARAE